MSDIGRGSMHNETETPEAASLRWQIPEKETPGQDRSAFLQELQETYRGIHYPPGFEDRYVIMECLAERNGIDTFLVQRQEDPAAAVLSDQPEETDAPPRFVAKCYDRTVWSIDTPEDILEGLEHDGLPKLVDTFEDERMIITVREYIEGVSLDAFALDNDLTERDVIRICVQLCDILEYLHHQPDPIIHRDIKPQNVIIQPDGAVSLIDFDIARTWRAGSETDTRFFGTIAYAPPEQYGFIQTDARADIYSLGILLRYLLTGSTRENKMVRIYKPLQKIILKCTAFSPDQRYSDVTQVRKALQRANPSSQRMRMALLILCALAAAAILFFAGWKIYEKVTYDPFNDEAIPAFVSDEERIADAVEYMQTAYDTDLFDDADAVGSIGLLRQIMIDLYGLDRDYVYGINEDIPQENDDYFLPWGWDDKQTVGRDVMVYAAVKVHDPSIVADWSSLSDDNGEYPGTRVALAFAEKTGIMTGVNRPDDITVGEMALILANAERVFAAATEEAE